MGASGSPCVSSSAQGTDCIVGLLLGAACCPDGTCALCEATADRMRRSGFPEVAVRRSLSRGRAGLLAACPLCGFPPPPPPDVMAPVPRLERPGRSVSGSWDCRTCGRPLPSRRRHYCSHACWREHVRRTEMDGDEIATPAAPRTYRFRVG
ncbi:MAG: hypothetical protein HMLKMBBP_01089 [Planctomycetes bacterium]|nr:hypothetical protein [Planctomycetota bacterium]